MSFLGKLAYLVLFPGLAFALFAGWFARAIFSGVSISMSGRRDGPDVASDIKLFGSPHSDRPGSVAVIDWAAPALKLFALAWVSCAVFGFLPDDLVLVFCLLLLAASCDVALLSFSGSENAAGEARWAGMCILGWLVPLAFIFASVSLRTGEVRLSAIVAWQATHGVLPLATGSGLMKASSIIGLVAILPIALGMAGLRPLGLNIFAGEAGKATGLTGPPLAESRLSRTAWAFIAPFLVAALFLAGPDTRWYYFVFWALKIAALVVIFAVANGALPRLEEKKALAWMAVPLLLGVVSLALAWVGVTP